MKLEPKAEVIADSISPNGDRVTTIVVTMHRFVLAEFNTHRVFSRNSASSRAIPVSKQLERYDKDAAYPLRWPCEQPGMQGGSSLVIENYMDAVELFDKVHDLTYVAVNEYLKKHPDPSTRLHKSVLNRLLEPFLWHTVIVTSTEWDNFFLLRCHELAQPEIRAAAEDMREAYNNSTPAQLDYTQWHLPFADIEIYHQDLAIVRSVACCAWVSTMNHDGDHSDMACRQMYDRLVSADPMHASPLEHQATPAHPKAQHQGNLQGWHQLRHIVAEGWQPILEDEL